MAFKVTIERSSFFSLISQAYGLIEKRSVMPILSKVLLCAKKKHLHIQATDQDNSLQSQVLAKVQAEGEIVVDAQTLFDILKELDDKEIILTSADKGKQIRLIQNASVFDLMGWSVDDFPSFPSFQMKESFTMKTTDLKQALEKTAYCSSTDETRYHLTGVFFEPIQNSESEPQKKIRLVSTDGHRLALSECFHVNTKQTEGVIIPKKGIVEIKKLLSFFPEENVEVSIEKPRILFRQEDTVLSIKLVEGTYPNYQQLIPKENTAKVIVKINSDRFSQALRRVSLLSNNRFKGVTFQITEKKIQMEAEHPELGSAQNEVDVIEKKGPDLKIRFNARYLLEALNNLRCEEIVTEFKDKISPCLVFPLIKDKKEGQVQKNICVIMPMQI